MKDFTRYEFQERLERMTELLRNEEGWGDAYESSTGQTLIQLMTHVTDELHYMLQRRTLEQYLETASLRSSIIARACELGYRFKRAKANNGILKIELDEPATTDIIVPIFSSLESDGVSYVTTETAVINTGETETTVRVKQGELVTITRQLEQGDIITLSDYELIDNENIIVSTSQGQFFDVRTQSDINKRALSFLKPTDMFYDIKYSVNGMCIVFGDNFQGLRPVGDVEIAFIKVNPENEQINTLDNEFSLTNGTSINQDHEITNITRIVDGSAPETDNSIKRNASDYHKTNGRAVTNNDYDFWIRDFDNINIVDAKTIGEDELRTVVFNLNNVYITYLKEDGLEFTNEELKQINDFMQTVKTSQAHLIFRPAEILPIQVIADVGRNLNSPIADAEVYDIVYNFLQDTFKLREGSIGKEYQSSDIVNDMYKLSVTRNNIRFPVIDYVKLKLRGVVDVTYPIETDRVLIELSNTYIPQNGHFFVLRINETPIQVEVFSSDSYFDIIERMANAIVAEIRILPRILFSDLLFDYDDKEFKVEKVDSGKTQTFQNTNGDFTISRISFSPSLKAEHFYYGRLEGRKPTIPVFNGVSASYTAPSDTNVRVYFRTDFSDYGTETLLTTINSGVTYNNTFNSNGFIVFDFVNNSSFDTEVVVDYPTFDLFPSVLEIISEDGISKFTVDKNFGNLQDFITANFEVYLPFREKDGSISNAISEEDQEDVILRESVVVYDEDGNIILTDNGFGKFLDSSDNIVQNISVNYFDGLVSINDSFGDDKIRIAYAQNIFDNIVVEDNYAMSLINPKDSTSSTEKSLSEIRIVR